MKKKTPLLLLSLLAVSCATPASLSLFDKKAAGNEFSLESEYKFGSTLKVPTLTKDGVTYSSIIVFPSGASYSLDEVTLNESGVYEIHYSAEKDGKYYSEDYSFLVRCPYFQFSGSKSYASYEQSDRTYGKKGLYVSLAEGEALTFNNPLDVSKGGTIFNGFAAPSNVGSMDFSELYLSLTDKEDKDNVVTIRAKSTNEGINNPWTYLAAKANDQPYVGYEANFNNIHINDEYGCPITHSFYGYYDGQSWLGDAKCGDYTISIDYKAEQKALYAGSNLITDFDDSTYYTTLWDGFKGDEATLAISAKGYSASSANFVILDVLGQDLTQEAIYDYAGPEITINTPEKLPAAKKGCTYPVFKASAYDEIDGECEVSVHAYYDFGGTDSLALPITDGRFETSRDGNYYLVYEAKDKSGNASQKIINISTGETEDLTIAPKGEVSKTIKIGEEYFFPEMEVKGGSGETEVYFTASKDGLKTGSSLSFIPTELGIHKIKATVTDVLGQEATYEYDLEVTSNDQAMIYEDIVVPKYYIADALYNLPTATCFDYSSGTMEEVVMDVKIDNNVYPYSLKAGELFVPKVNKGQEEITLTFSYKNLSIEKKALVISPYVVGNDGIERFCIENYLVTENATLDVLDTEIDLIAKQKGDLKADFVNPLLAESATVTLNTLPSKGELQNLELTFTDSLDSKQSVTMKLEKKGTAECAYYTLGAKSYLTKTSLAESNNLEFSYSSGVFTFNETGIKASTYDNGEAFNGFSSGKVYVSVKAKNLASGMGFAWTRIDNQSMSYASSDYNAPRIQIVGDYGGSHSLGEVATINKVNAGDVLDPNALCYVSVSSPSGEVAKGIDGVSLSLVKADKEYQVKLEEYGQYIVTYKAMDTNGESTTFIYAINVEDEEAPVITLKNEPASEIALGDYIRLPEYEVSDNSGKEVTVSIYVDTPDGRSYLMSGDRNCFKPESQGVYTLRIRAMDESGNISYLTRSITVK